MEEEAEKKRPKSGKKKASPAKKGSPRK